MTFVLCILFLFECFDVLFEDLVIGVEVLLVVLELVVLHEAVELGVEVLPVLELGFHFLKGLVSFRRLSFESLLYLRFLFLFEFVDVLFEVLVIGVEDLLVVVELVVLHEAVELGVVSFSK